MTDVNQITRKMTDGPRVLVTIPTERDTNITETSFVAANCARLSLDSTNNYPISFSLFEEKGKSTNQDSQKIKKDSQAHKKTNSTLV